MCMEKELRTDEPEDIMDFAELRGYIGGWLAKYQINKKDFDGNERVIRSIDYYFDCFVDEINDLRAENETRNCR